MHGELAESCATIICVLECEMLTHVCVCVGSYVEQVGLCTKYFMLSRVFISSNLQSMSHGKDVTDSFLKKIFFLDIAL